MLVFTVIRPKNCQTKRLVQHCYLKHFHPNSTNNMIQTLTDGYTTTSITGVHRHRNNFAEDRQLVVPEASPLG